MRSPVIQPEGGVGQTKSAIGRFLTRKMVGWTEDVPELWHINVATRTSSLLLLFELRCEHGSGTRHIVRCHPAVLECIRVLDGTHPLDSAHMPELVLVPTTSLLREAAFEPREPMSPDAAVVRLSDLWTGSIRREGDIAPACDSRGACNSGDCEHQVHYRVQVQQ
jgi:hypothetical protein